MLDFKQPKGCPHICCELIKTCVAFANGAGGKIIIGVEDKTTEVICMNKFKVP